MPSQKHGIACGSFNITLKFDPNPGCPDICGALSERTLTLQLYGFIGYDDNSILFSKPGHWIVTNARAAVLISGLKVRTSTTGNASMWLFTFYSLFSFFFFTTSGIKPYLMHAEWWTKVNLVLHDLPLLTPYWNKNVIILMIFSSLAALEVVILTISSAASDENVTCTCIHHVMSYSDNTRWCRQQLGGHHDSSWYTDNVMRWLINTFSQLLIWDHLHPDSVWGCCLAGMGVPSWRRDHHRIISSPQWGFLYCWDSIFVVICIIWFYWWYKESLAFSSKSMFFYDKGLLI